MESKLIILIVMFLSVAQGSTDLSLKVDHRLSDDQLATLTQIIVKQDETIQAKFDGFDPIFDTILKYVSPLIWNVEARIDDDLSKIFEALTRAKDAIDYSLDALSISLQKSCDAVEVARVATHADLDNLYAVALQTLTLASSGNYSENRAQLEGYWEVAQGNIKDLVSNIYAPLHTCLTTTDVDTLNVVQTAQKRSELALLSVANYVLNAIKLYTAAVTAERANISLISEIEDCRRYARIGLREDVENKFGALKTLYIATQLNLTEIISGLAKNQYARTVSFYRFETGTEAVFRVINARLTGVALGLSNTGNADSSVTVLAQAEAVAQLTAGHEVFLMSILSDHPSAICAVSHARKIFSTSTTTAVNLYFDAIAAAQCQDSSLSKCLAKIECLKNSAFSNNRSYVNLIYKLLRNGETWDDESEAEFKTYQDDVADLINAVTGSIFDASVVLAKATKAGKANADDFSAINADKTLAIAALDNFTENISAAGVIALKASSKLLG